MLGNEKPTSLRSKTAGVGVGWPSTSGDVAISTQSTLRASARSSGCRVLALVPPFSSSPCPLSSWPRRTCEPPYEQMLVGIRRVRSFSPPPSPSAPRRRSPCCVPHLMVGWVVSSPYPSPILHLPVVPVHPHPASTLRAVARSGGGVGRSFGKG